MASLRFAPLALLICACTLRSPPGDDSDDSDDSGATTSSTTSGDPTTGSSNSGPAPTTGPSPPATTAPPEPDPDPDPPGDTGDTQTSCGFVDCGPSTGEPGLTCDGLKQLEPDCADGQKCTLDEELSRTHCVDIAPAPKGLYEPCTVVGLPFSGVDDCGLGMICWDADEQGHGTCLGLCNSDDGGNTLTCVDPTARCSFCQECAVGFCLPGCDPLLGECSAGNVCVFDSTDFICVVDSSGDEGQVHDPCEFLNACDDGLACVTAEAAVECDPNIIGCCQPYCDLTLPNPCTGAGQVCAAWYAEGQAPPGQEHIGVCSVPIP